MSETNGRFWKTIATIFTIILVPLLFGSFAYTYGVGAKVERVAVKIADEMVRNDHIRQQEDKAIATDLQNKVDIINKDVGVKLDKILDGQIKQGERLSRIEQKLEMK